MKTFHLIIIAYLLVAIITLQSRYNLSAQVPDNFEFLDHTTSFNTPGAHKTLDDGIVFTSHNLFSTNIFFAGYENTLINLDSVNKNSDSTSKIYEINDSTYQIVLYALTDYDVFAPGIIIYTLSNNEVISRISILADDYDNFISDYEQSINGDSWLISGFGKMYRLSSEYEIQESHSNITVDNIFLDNQDRLFGISNFGGTSQLLQFREDVFEPLANFDLSLRDISEFGQFKYLLFRNELRRYNTDFSELLSTWPLPMEITSFNQIELFQDYVIIAYSSNLNSIDKLYNNGMIEQIWQGSKDASPGTFTQLNVQNDSLLMTSGVYDFLDTSQSFFRSIPLDITPNYQRHQVNLSSVSAKQMIIDSTFLGANTTGDSTWLFLREYDLDFEIENSGQRSASEIHIYGPLKFPFGSSENEHFLLQETVNPQEIANFIFTETSENSFDGATFGIPGVELRFNQGSTALVDFTSSIENIFAETSAIYPNPTSNVLYLPELSSSVSVFNTAGQLVIQKNNISDNQLDVSQLQSGIYNLVMQSLDSKQFHSLKFIKR